jgi:hypothetical protein
MKVVASSVSPVGLVFRLTNLIKLNYQYIFFLEHTWGLHVNILKKKNGLEILITHELPVYSAIILFNFVLSRNYISSCCILKCYFLFCTEGLEKSLLPLRLKIPTVVSNDCFDKYWQYKSTPNASYEDAEKCLRLALHSNPPVMAALLPLIQVIGSDVIAYIFRSCLIL